MKNLFVELNVLPDEILLIIWKKLPSVEVLYYLIGLNDRFNAIAHDPIFTSHLILLMKCSSDDFIYPLPDPMIDRLCLEILPEIHHRIKWLELESSSMKRILHATSYPSLCGLGIYGIDVERAISLFTAQSVLTPTVKNQLTSFVIDFIQNEEQSSTKDVNALIFTQIFTTFTSLKYLNFGPSRFRYQRLSFSTLSSPVISSTLLELNVYLENFNDCLYLLDGRFDQLRILNVKMDLMYPSSLSIYNKEKLPSLRYFSLLCGSITIFYDELVIPLLHRMVNLEKLDLNIAVHRYEGFVDGDHLKKNIIDFMPRLNKFIFYIRSCSFYSDKINFPSNEDIQNRFKDFSDSKIISWIDYFEESKYGQCHIYSYPYSYRLERYDGITNHFPGGLFEYVREITLFDERPFEHQFFIRISQSFPLLEEIILINQKPQKHKQRRKAKNDKQDLLIIEYPHLTRLNLREAHDDYIEQFLVDTKMSLPNDVYLLVDYKSLKRVTHNFKRAATQINCTKLTYLYTNDGLRYPKHFKDYFPHVYTDVL